MMHYSTHRHPTEFLKSPRSCGANASSMFGLGQCVSEQLSQKTAPFVWEICCGGASGLCHNHRQGARLHVPQECKRYVMQRGGKTTVEQCRFIIIAQPHCLHTVGAMYTGRGRFEIKMPQAQQEIMCCSNGKQPVLDKNDLLEHLHVSV